RWTVRETEGRWVVLEQRVEAVKLDITQGGNKILYDSTRPAPADNPLTEFVKALVGTEFRYTLDQDLRIVRVEGAQEFLARQKLLHPDLHAVLEPMVADDCLRQMSQPLFAAVPGPNRRVADNDTWTWPREGV